MKILVVGDCHGVKPDIEQEGEEADLILATGDICGDADEMREAMFKSIESEKNWYDLIGREKTKKLVNKSIEEGDEVLKYLNSFDKPVFLVPGNWDWIGDEEDWNFLSQNYFQELIDKYSNIQNINCERIQDSEFTYIGYGPCSGPEVPQYEDDRPGKEEMEDLRKEYKDKLRELRSIFDEAEKPVIFLSHNTPNQTKLDQIRNPNSPADGRHYGSLVVKNLIEEKTPLLSIAGHIHEGYGRENVSGTEAINAGLESHVLIELSQAKIKDVVFNPSLQG